MQRWSSNSTENANTFYWCDCIIKWVMLYMICITLYRLYDTIKALEDKVRYMHGEINTELGPKKVQNINMQRWSFNSIGNANTFYWCDWITKWDLLYIIFPTLYTSFENIERDEMFSEIQTNENINGGGKPNLRLIVEQALEDMVRNICGETNTELGPKKIYEMFDQKNAAVSDWNGQNIKEMQKEKLMENILKTPWRRNINEEIFPKNINMLIRAEYLKTILRMKIQEEEIFEAIQGHSFLISKKYPQCIRERQWKISFVLTLKDANLSGKFLGLPSSETMTCQHQHQLEREPIHTETDIEEEKIKKIRIRTLRIEKNAGKLNELTETTGSRMDNNGVLEKYKNGNEEYGKLGKTCQKNSFSKASIKRRHKKETKCLKPTKPYAMLLHCFVVIWSLGKCLSTMQKVVLCICICVICPAVGLNRECLASISTKKIVTECPKSVEDFTKRACEMNCHQIPQNCTSPDNFQYHCLQTEDINIFVEVCAEVKYISCHCAMYDTTAGIVQTDNNNRFKGTLENCTYRSNKFNARGCRGIFEAFNSTEQFSNISMRCPADFENKKTANTNMDSFERNDNAAIAAVVAAIVIFVVFIAFLLIVRKSAAKRRQNRPIEEGQPLHRLQGEN